MTKKDIILNNKGLFERNLSLNILQVLNDILEADLDDITKNNILSLILNCNEREEYLIDLVYNFFLNEHINKKPQFKKIIKLMQSKEKTLNFYSIITYALIGKKTPILGEYKALKLVENLINLPDDYGQNFYLIKSLLEKSEPEKDRDRFDIIIDVLIKNKASYDVLNGKDTTPFITFVLTNKAFDYHNREFIDFKKIVEFAINNSNWHFLYTLLKEKIEVKKIDLAVDYYISLKDKYILKYDFIPLDILDKNFKNEPLYKLPLNIANLPLIAYTKKLNMVKNSSNPLSYSIIELSDLEAEKKNFVLALIDSCPEEDIDRRYHNKLAVDYLYKLVTIAISPSMKTLDITSYKDLLNYLKTCILENKALEKEKNSNKKIDASYLDDRTYLIPSFLNNLFESPIIANNIPRLKHLIELIKTLNKNNRYVISEIIEIAKNPNSLYYTDEEFKKIESILDYIQKSGYTDNVKQDKDKYFILKYLFMSDNVPFMNKNDIFDIAINKTEEEIKTLVNSFRKEGLINRNISILEGTLQGPLEREYILIRK